MRLKQEKSKRNKPKASLVIVVSGLISKLLAALYRIPYQNLVGDRGFYAYQQIYPLLAIISTLGLVALPNLLSSLYHSLSKRSIASLFQLEVVVSFILGFCFVLFGSWLAILMGARELGLAVRMTGLNCFALPFIAFYRGLSQAEDEMQPTAVSQVIEQFVRIAVILFSAIAFVSYKLDIYQTATLASFGNVLASFIVLLYLVLKTPYRVRNYLNFKKFDWSFLPFLGFRSSVFIVFSIYLLLFQMVDAFLVKSALQFSGLSETLSETIKGIYDRGQPLIQFGLIISTGLLTSYLPYFTQLYSENQQRYQEEKQKLYEVMVYLNLTLTVGFIAILPQMNQVLFKDNVGEKALLLYLTLIFWSSLLQLCYQNYFIERKNQVSFIYLIIGFVFKLCLTAPFTYWLGPVGSSLSSLFPMMLLTGLYLKGSGLRQTWLKNKRFLFALTMMFVLVKTLGFFLPHQTRLGLLLNLVLSSAIGGSIFLLYSLKRQVFSKELWVFLPLFKKK